MKSVVPQSAEWMWGAVRVWLRPHQASQRGEPMAREVLGQALGWAPEALPLARDARGRPDLQAPLAHFDTSWSHSGGQLLVGLGERVRLGVDLEWQRPRPNMRAVAARFFHPDEVAWLAGVDDTACSEQFFRLWCAKEALLKAHGHGLSFGLHRMCFGEEDGALVLRRCDPALGETSRWRLHEWEPAPQYRAALAWYRQPTP